MSKKQNEQEASAEAPEEVAAEEQAPGIGVQDLGLMLQIIQMIQSRGAVKPEEMEVVGGLYTRLHGFLDANGFLNPPEETAEEGQ